MLLLYKIIVIVFDKYTGNSVYSIITIVIALLAIISSLIQNNKLVQLIIAFMIIIPYIIYICSVLLPIDFNLPNCLKFDDILKEYIDYNFYDSNLKNGISWFVISDKLVHIILQFIIVFSIFNYDKDKLNNNIFYIKNNITNNNSQPLYPNNRQ